MMYVFCKQTLAITLSFALILSGCGSTTNSSSKSDTVEETISNESTTEESFDNSEDVAAVVTDLNATSILYSAGDNESYVTRSITLPRSGVNGTTITWRSSDATVITDYGFVTSPTTEEGNATVTLTATVSKGDASDSKSFTLTVIANPDMDDVQADTSALAIGYTHSDSANHITDNIILPTQGANGSSIVWISDAPSIINNKGVVTRPDSNASNTTVVLDASIIKEHALLKKSFELHVMAMPTSAQEAVDNDRAWAVPSYANGDSSSSVTRDLQLPASGPSGTTISWGVVSGYPTIKSSGEVTRAEDNTSVTLRATISKDGVSDTIDSTVTIKSATAFNDAVDIYNMILDLAGLPTLPNKEGFSIGNEPKEAHLFLSIPKRTTKEATYTLSFSNLSQDGDGIDVKVYHGDTLLQNTTAANKIMFAAQDEIDYYLIVLSKNSAAVLEQFDFDLSVEKSEGADTLWGRLAKTRFAGGYIIKADDDPEKVKCGDTQCITTATYYPYLCAMEPSPKCTANDSYGNTIVVTPTSWQTTIGRITMPESFVITVPECAGSIGYSIPIDGEYSASDNCTKVEYMGAVNSDLSKDILVRVVEQGKIAGEKFTQILADIKSTNDSSENPIAELTTYIDALVASTASPSQKMEMLLNDVTNDGESEALAVLLALLPAMIAELAKNEKSALDEEELALIGMTMNRINERRANLIKIADRRLQEFWDAVKDSCTYMSCIYVAKNFPNVIGDAYSEADAGLADWGTAAGAGAAGAVAGVATFGGAIAILMTAGGGTAILPHAAAALSISAAAGTAGAVMALPVTIIVMGVVASVITIANLVESGKNEEAYNTFVAQNQEQFKTFDSFLGVNHNERVRGEIQIATMKMIEEVID